ncbi:MAG: MFS transporter [Clostridiales bacterium]|nr:MFS transporter [Clostridiales bacterium]
MKKIKVLIKNITHGIPKEELFLFLAIAISLLGDSNLYVLLPIFAEDIGIPLVAVGILLSANRFTRLITNYYAAYLYSYMGSRRMFIMSIILASITTFVYGLPVGAVVLTISRVVWGSCWSFMRFVGLTRIAGVSTDENRGTLTGIYQSVVSIGSLVAVPIGGILSSIVGYRNTFYILSGLTLVVGLWLTALSLRPSRDYDYDEIIETKEKAIIKKQKDIPKKTERNIDLKSIYSLSFLNSWISSGLLISTIGYILLLKFGESVKLLNWGIEIQIIAGLLVSIQRFFGLFLPVFSGRLADRYGRIKTVILTCLIQSIALIIIALTNLFTTLSLSAILGFIGITILSNVLTAIAIGYNDMNKDKNILGHFTTWQDIGSAFGAMAGYSLVIAIGYRNTYIMTAIVLMIALGITTKRYYLDIKIDVAKN